MPPISTIFIPVSNVFLLFNLNMGAIFLYLHKLRSDRLASAGPTCSKPNKPLIIDTLIVLLSGTDDINKTILFHYK